MYADTRVKKRVGKYYLSAYPTSEHESAHNVKVKSYLIIWISVLTAVSVMSEFLYLRWEKTGI